MTNIFRGPLIFRPWPKDPSGVAIGSQSYVTSAPRNVNLLIKQDRIYGPPGMVPDYDWTNPVLPKSSVVALNAEYWVFQPRNHTLYVGKDIFFRTAGYAPNYDWPNPVLPKSKQIAVEAQTLVDPHRLNNLLVGQDRIYGPPGMVPDYDWPNPVLRKAQLAAAPSEAQNLLTMMLSATAPFVPDEWPNPIKRPFAVITLEPQNFLALLLGALPFNQKDWPNPLKRAGADQRDLFQSLVLSTLVGAKPFFVTDWALPTPRRATVPFEGGGADLLNTLLVPIPLPHNQADWPNPTIRAREPGPNLIPQNPLNTIYVGQGARPFFTLDWNLAVIIRRGQYFDSPNPVALTALRFAPIQTLTGSAGSSPSLGGAVNSGQTLGGVAAGTPTALGAANAVAGLEGRVPSSAILSGESS